MSKENTPETASAMPQAEVIKTDKHRVSCDGGGGALGHPKVYMDMGQASFVECKYCDRRFELTAH